jgi:hypothetical protein
MGKHLKGHIMSAMATSGDGAIRAGQEVDSPALRTVSATIRPLILRALPDGSHEFANREWRGLQKLPIRGLDRLGLAISDPPG